VGIVVKHSITDTRYLGSILGGGWFLFAAGVVLYVWATSMHPYPDRLGSVIFYYAVLCALMAVVLGICIRGFTYRRTEVNDEGLVVHEGFYGLIWKNRVITKSQITAVECYEGLRSGMFTHVRTTGIRVCMSDGSTMVLAESDGTGAYQKYCSKVEEARCALGLPEGG
jgi:hypothetical protein